MDFELVNHGSVWLCKPQNDAAREHLEASVPEDAQWWCNGVVVEPRCVAGLTSGLQADGYSVGLE